MSDTIYIWGAKSPSKGYKFHEQFPGQPLVRQKSLAQRNAESFAMRLNQKNHMDINDWVPIVESREKWIGTSDYQ